MITDEQLAARAASGDELATRLLLDRLSGLIGGASLSFFATGLERQDFEQEARIAIHEAARSFDLAAGLPFASFASYVVRRRLIDLVKKAQRQKHRSMNEALLFSMPVGNPEEDLILGDTLVELRSSEPVDVLQPLKVGCAIDGCNWPGVELPNAEARAASLAHRLAVHPERADAGKLLRQRQKDVRAEKGLRPVAIPRSDVPMEEEAA